MHYQSKEMLTSKFDSAWIKKRQSIVGRKSHQKKPGLGCNQPFPVAEKKTVVPFREHHSLPYQLKLSIAKTPKNSRHVLVLSSPPHAINAISEPHRSGLFKSAKQKVIPIQMKKQKCSWYETFILAFA